MHAKAYHMSELTNDKANASLRHSHSIRSPPNTSLPSALRRLSLHRYANQSRLRLWTILSRETLDRR